MTGLADPGISEALLSGPSSGEPVTTLLVLVFACELGMLGGLAVIGAALGSGVVASIGLAIALPVLAGTIWALFLAPTASRRLPRVPRLAAKLVLFVGTGIGLAVIGFPIAGITFVVVSAVIVIAAYAQSDLT